VSLKRESPADVATTREAITKRVRAWLLYL
jgi:hypothetical protein